MGVFIFICIVVAIALLLDQSKKKAAQKSAEFFAYGQGSKPRTTKTRSVATDTTTRTKVNTSVMDVTGQSHKITVPSLPSTSNTRVPYWTHHYVYSYSEIEAATHEQKSFYRTFKSFFLKGEYIDLQGNTNYAFVLFFNLLDEFLIHKDLTKIKSQLYSLGKHHPKTAPYINGELIKRLRVLGNVEAIVALESERTTSSYYSEYQEWKLGEKYKSLLNLSADQVILLNQIWTPVNNFAEIEYCRIEIIKLFLETIERLKNHYTQTGSSLEEQCKALGDIVARKHFKYRLNSPNYGYAMDQVRGQIYSTIFKYSENALREKYDHKRKLSVEFYNDLSQLEFTNRFGAYMERIHLDIIQSIAPPDKSTEIELNARNTLRWKTPFGKIITDFDGKSDVFMTQIKSLTAKNKKNPSLENIYFEASKFISKSDKQAGLQLYLYYLYCDLESTKFDNKQLTKTVQKSLLTSDAQLQEFKQIVSDLITTKDLNKALTAAQGFYGPKRKKITLNKDAIAEVHQKHSGTLELLNDYLSDDAPLSTETDTEEIEIELPTTVADGDSSKAPSKLTVMQQQLLLMFQNNDFTLSSAEIDTFAKSKAQFRNQLIESINDACYEVLDDILIEEEEEENYTINPDYYQRILTL